MEIVTMIPFTWIFIGVQNVLLSLFVKKTTNKQKTQPNNKQINMDVSGSSGFIIQHFQET